MAKSQPCYLLSCGADPAEASFCESLAEATEQFQRQATRSIRYEGAEFHNTYADVYFVDAQGDDFDPATPDRRLMLTHSYRVKATTF